MFTGLIEVGGKVLQRDEPSPGARLIIEANEHQLLECGDDAAVGDSVAINGCCLTVVGRDRFELSFDVGPETLRCTNLGRLAMGSPVNLEFSMPLGKRLGGHFVTGHVDGVGVLDERRDEAEWSTFWFRAPFPLLRQMASKGSISVDGVSLTLVKVTADRFSVALIPHTLNATTLGALQPGGEVNLETDILAKYVERQLALGRESLP